MEDRTKQLVSKGLPWRRETGWPVVALEAAVLIVVGAFILIDTDAASDVILQLIGVVLLATSVLLGMASLRNSEAGLGSFDAFRAGIGVAVGVVATSSWWSDYIDNHAVRIVLGWGLIAYSLLHVVGLIVVQGRAGLRPTVLVTVGLTLILGIVLLTGDDTTSTNRMNILGIALLVFGALLAALAYYLYSRRDRNAMSGTGPVAPQ